MNNICFNPTQNNSYKKNTSSAGCQFDTHSIRQVAGDASQLMVYGFSHILEATGFVKYLKSLDEIQKVFIYNIGSDAQENAEGREIERIGYDVCAGEKTTNKVCKSGLVNLVLENYKRRQLNLPLIPLLFCVDVDGNPHPFKMEVVATRDNEENSRITHKELRRCFKLCCGIENTRIREVAAETFKFVKFSTDNGADFTLEELSPFWQSSEWTALWKKRQETPKDNPRHIKVHPWKSEVQNAVSRLNIRK